MTVPVQFDTGESRRLLRGLSAPREARAFLRQLLAREPPEAVELAVLLTSELVTNAVVHGAGDTVLDVQIAPDKGRLLVSVADEATDLPVFHQLSPERDSGRGIAIVDHFSKVWGIERRSDDGKRVWFELRLHA